MDVIDETKDDRLLVVYFGPNGGQMGKCPWKRSTKAWFWLCGCPKSRERVVERKRKAGRWQKRGRGQERDLSGACPCFARWSILPLSPWPQISPQTLPRRFPRTQPFHRRLLPPPLPADGLRRSGSTISGMCAHAQRSCIRHLFISHTV